MATSKELLEIRQNETPRGVGIQTAAGGDYLNMYQVVDGTWQVVEKNISY